jgi:hypothetical protein
MDGEEYPIARQMDRLAGEPAALQDRCAQISATLEAVGRRAEIELTPQPSGARYLVRVETSDRGIVAP